MIGFGVGVTFIRFRVMGNGVVVGFCRSRLFTLRGNSCFSLEGVSMVGLFWWEMVVAIDVIAMSMNRMEGSTINSLSFGVFWVFLLFFFMMIIFSFSCVLVGLDFSDRGSVVYHSPLILSPKGTCSPQGSCPLRGGVFEAAFKIKARVLYIICKLI